MTTHPPIGSGSQALAITGFVAPDLDAIVDRLSDLPTLAPVAVEVLALADDEDASLGDIARVISRDPGLAAKLLWTANSPAYAPAQPISNLMSAMALLGLRTVKLLSLGFSLVTSPITDAPGATVIWQRSLLTSILARRAAEFVAPHSVDDAFAAGLLSHIGKLALADDPGYQLIQRHVGPWLTAHQEREVLGFTSDEATARILERWGLPVLLAAAIRGRSQIDGPESSPPDGNDSAELALARVLRVGDAASHLLLVATDADRVLAYDDLTMSAATHLGWTMPQMSALMVDARDEVAEVSAMFELGRIAAIDTSELLTSAREHHRRLADQAAEEVEDFDIDGDEPPAPSMAVTGATDTTTGLPSRQTLLAFLANRTIGDGQRTGNERLGLILVDLTELDTIAGTYGPAVADEVLVEAAHRLGDAVRDDDLLAHNGPGVFALVTTTTSDELQVIINRVRTTLEAEPVATAEGPVSIEVRIGVALGTDVKTPASVLHWLADSALYEARHGSTGRVVLASPTGDGDRG